MSKQTGTSGIAYVGTAKSITDASHSAGTVTVTSAGHGFSAGDMILIESVVGMTDLNGHWVIDAVATDTFDITLTTAQSYTSGGTAQEVIELTSWELEMNEPILDSTDSSNAGWREYTEKGISGAAGTISGFRLSGFNPLNWIAQSLSLKLYQASGHYWSGTGIIKRLAETIPISAEELNRLTYEWEGTGEWSETTP